MSTRFLLPWLALPFATAAVAAPTSTDAVIDAARVSVEAALGQRYGQIDLEVTGRPSAVPASDVALRAMPVVGRFPRERFTVDVDLLRNGRVVGKATVGFALHASTEGWVYSKDAHDHDLVAAVAMERQTVDAAHGEGVTPDQLEGLRLKRNVRAGKVVALADFERVPDIDNRQSIRLLAAFGDITVESAGMAMRAGNRGDVVTVQVDGATAPVKATVTDRGVAELVQ
jgi:flagella basal body P-ring formation protein FlgA